MAAFNKFNQFVQDLAQKVHNLNADTFKIALFLSAPAGTETGYNDTGYALLGGNTPAEIATGNGYTRNGASAGTPTATQTAGTLKFTLGTDPVWTASGGAIANFRYAVLYNSSGGSSGNRPLIGYWDYGSTLTVNTGETFTVDLDQTNGVLTLA